MKKIFLPIFLMISLLIFSGCSQSTPTTESEATKLMDQFMTYYKSQDFQSANDLTTDPSFVYFEVVDDPVFPAEAQQKAIDLMCEFEYVITNEVTEDNVTTLTVELTGNNVGELYMKGMRALVMENLQGQEGSESQGEIVSFTDVFNETPESYKTTFDVQLEKDQDGTLKIIPNGDFLNALMGDMYKRMQELSQSVADIQNNQ